MERLTDKYWRNFDPWEFCGQDNYCKRGCHDPGGCRNGCIVPKLYSRLALYEETGLGPEEIKELKADWYVANQLIQEYKAIGKVEHALSLLKAEHDGRLLVLPCKIGDTLYMIVKKPIPEKGWLRYVRRFSLTYKNLAWVLRCLGKRVFPSSKEAEAAISDMERKAGAEIVRKGLPRLMDKMIGGAE